MKAHDPKVARAIQCLYLVIHARRMTRQVKRLRAALKELNGCERRQVVALGTALGVPLAMARRAVEIEKQNLAGHDLILEIADTIFDHKDVSKAMGVVKPNRHLDLNPIPLPI